MTPTKSKSSGIESSRAKKISCVCTTEDRAGKMTQVTWGNLVDNEWIIVIEQLEFGFTLIVIML